MSQPKISQTVLYEVLVAEIESLKNTKRDYEQISSQVREHLGRLEALYNQPISVDIEAMRAEHSRIAATLRTGLYIPKWLGITFFCLILGLSVSLLFNYKQHLTNQDQRMYLHQAELYINELKAKLPRSKR